MTILFFAFFLHEYNPAKSTPNPEDYLPTLGIITPQPWRSATLPSNDNHIFNVSHFFPVTQLLWANKNPIHNPFKTKSCYILILYTYIIFSYTDQSVLYWIASGVYKPANSIYCSAVAFTNYQSADDNYCSVMSFTYPRCH